MLTQPILASKRHLTQMALVRFLLRMSTFMIGKFGAVPQSFTTVPASERIVCVILATSKVLCDRS